MIQRKSWTQTKLNAPYKNRNKGIQPHDWNTTRLLKCLEERNKTQHFKGLASKWQETWKSTSALILISLPTPSNPIYFNITIKWSATACMNTLIFKFSMDLKGEQPNLSFNLDKKNWEAHKPLLNQKQSRDLLQWHCESNHIKATNPIKQLLFNVFLY